MKLLHSSDDALCILTAFAMVFDMDPDELQAEIGSNWQSIAFSGLPQPYCWRGYHVQEFIRYAVQRGYAITPIELAPVVAPPMIKGGYNTPPYPNVPIYLGDEAEARSWQIFKNIVLNSRGILTGLLVNASILIRGHAVAYEHGVIYDPRGRTFYYSAEECESRGFYANCAWRVDRMKQDETE
jgi:hypothetical protein